MRGSGDVDHTLPRVRRQVGVHHIDTRSACRAGGSGCDCEPRSCGGSRPSSCARSENGASAAILRERTGRRVNRDLSQGRKGSQAKRDNLAKEFFCEVHVWEFVVVENCVNDSAVIIA